jgi:hypothetical protein
MALIKTGGGIAEIRGSIGGTTFSRGRYGAIARNRTVPVQPNTERQSIIRQQMGSIVQGWLALTDDQRANWQVYANQTPVINRLGETIYLSGQNHYVRSNMCRMSANINEVVEAPTVFNLGATDPTLTVDAAELLDAVTPKLTVEFNEGLSWVIQVPGNKQAAAVIYFGSPQNASVSYYKGPWTIYNKIPAEIAPGVQSPATVTNIAGGNFAGSPGQKVWFAYRILWDDGRCTTLQTLPPAILEA